MGSAASEKRSQEVRPLRRAPNSLLCPLPSPSLPCPHPFSFPPLSPSFLLPSLLPSFLLPFLVPSSSSPFPSTPHPLAFPCPFPLLWLEVTSGHPQARRSRRTTRVKQHTVQRNGTKTKPYTNKPVTTGNQGAASSGPGGVLT